MSSEQLQSSSKNPSFQARPEFNRLAAIQWVRSASPENRVGGTNEFFRLRADHHLPGTWGLRKGVEALKKRDSRDQMGRQLDEDQ
jgi:hypothetical protein